MDSLRQQALRVLLECNADEKARLAVLMDSSAPTGAQDPLTEVQGIPGRPQKPELVPHTQLKARSMATMEGRAALLHALAHIEFNAIDLACDAAVRFSGMPDDFYRQWIQVAREEAYHFSLLRDHLRSMGFDYGDFPAHNALWEMAEKNEARRVGSHCTGPKNIRSTWA